MQQDLGSIVHFYVVIKISLQVYSLWTCELVPLYRTQHLTSVLWTLLLFIIISSSSSIIILKFLLLSTVGYAALFIIYLYNTDKANCQ